MPESPEQQELLSYVDGLVEATRTSKMEWKAANPTTFYWEKSEAATIVARLSLQRVDQNTPTVQGGVTRTIVQRHYVLQAMEVRPGTTTIRFTATSQNDPTLQEKLEQLYAAIHSVSVRRSLDFLKSILPGS